MNVEPAKVAASRLPATIRICGFTIEIKFMSDLKSYSEGNYAYFSATCQEICLREGFVSPEKLVDSFLHELNHAVFHYYGIGKDDCEERIVATLGKAWTQIFGDNPWLTGWIGETLNPSCSFCGATSHSSIPDNLDVKVEWQSTLEPRTARFGASQFGKLKD